MTTRTTTAIADTFTTDAAFRAYCTMWHNNFQATGMVQTSDTGQINLATVLTPSTSNQSRGYEIWRFNDALQGAAPIFIKVEYGSSTTNQNNAQMWITVGTGSDGAGNLSFTGWPGASNLIARSPVSTSSTGSLGNQVGNVYFTYLADNSWAFLAWPTNTSDYVGTWFVSVERFRNADGTPNGDGVNLFMACGNSQNSVATLETRYYLSGTTQPTSSVSGWQTPAAVPATTAVVGSTLYPIPVFTGRVPRLAAPSQFVTVLGRTDLAAGLTFTMDHYGSSCVWQSGGPGYTNGGLGPVGPGTLTSLALRTDP